MYSTGALRSTNDSRDWIAESIHPRNLDLPLTLDLRKDLQPIRDQGKQGSCVAFSASAMKEWQERKELGLERYMSPQFIYNNRENQDSEGMFGRDLMKILTEVGCCLESDYYYGTIEAREKINTEVYEKAKPFKISGYAQIQTIEGLKRALYKNGPCVILFPVYNHGATMWMQSEPKQSSTGGHAMCVVGYTEKAFIIRNSWGDDWNNNGYCEYPFEQFGAHWEIWTTIDANSSLEETKNIEKQENKCLPFLRMIAVCSHRVKK